MNNFDRSFHNEKGSTHDGFPPSNGDHLPPPPPPKRGQPPMAPPMAEDDADDDSASDSNGVYLYNVADGLEEDPEIIRSELLFFNTPRVQMYSDYVYYSLKNIEAECSIDFENLCDNSPQTFVFNVDFSNTLSQFLFPTLTIASSSFSTPDVRKLSSVALKQASPAQQLVNNLRKLYFSALPVAKRDYLSAMVLRPFSTDKKLEDAVIPTHTWTPPSINPPSTDKKLEDAVIPKHTWTPPSINPPKASPLSAAEVKAVKPKQSGRRRLHPNHDNNHDNNNNHNHRPPQGPPPPDSDSDSDSEDEDEEDSPPSNKKPPCHHPSPPPDNSFAGAIGFGAEGDLCMYQNLDSLSPPCQQAVADLYQLRQSFWTEDQTPPPPGPPHHPWLLLVPLFLLFLALLFKRRRQMKRNKEVNQLLASLHKGDASLKAAVEQQAKMSLPAVVTPTPCTIASVCIRVVKTLLLLVFVLFSSLVIAVSSLEITASVVNRLEEGGPPVSAPVALLVLVSVCAAELSLFFVLVKLGKTMWAKHCGVGRGVPSAPLMEEEDEEEVGRGNGGGRFLLVRKKIQELRNFAFNSFRFPAGQTSQSQYYTPLLAHEDNTEMTSVTTANPTVVRWQASPQAPQQYAIVPVTANTFNNISMV